MVDGRLGEGGVALIGCGRMGQALLERWIADGLALSNLSVFEPSPSDWLRNLAIEINTPLPSTAICVFAVKPQMMPNAVATARGITDRSTLILSIAAGIRLAFFEAEFGPTRPVIRAMPNTPAAVGQGISALIGNRSVRASHWRQATRLLGAVGETLQVADEALMDAVTAISGSGPAYVFHFMEALAAAGTSVGLSAQDADRLARATVIGAGALAASTEDSAADLRRQVTSPGGTTEAAMISLMDPQEGLTRLLTRAALAAAGKARELGQQD